MRTTSSFLITVALIAGMVGCVSGPVQYDLTISVTEGGELVTPSEATSIYDEGTVVPIVVFPHAGYRFVDWTGDVDTIADVNAASTTITMNGDYEITATFGPLEILEIRDWHDLNTIRNKLGSSYILMNNLDSTTAGYEELASSTANGGKGWQPIGTEDDSFTGSFDGRGYEICDLFINRPDEGNVGLFGEIDGEGVIKDTGEVNATVSGKDNVGSLVGQSSGTVSRCCSSANVTGHEFVGALLGDNSGGAVSNSYATGSVSGTLGVGGLVGSNDGGTVSNSYATSNVAGNSCVGGLVGWSYYGTVSDSYSSGDVTGDSIAGGLVGFNFEGTVSNSYSAGGVTGHSWVGGLVGRNDYGAVTNSYYNCDEALINGESIITSGALFSEDFEQWLANNMSLDINERLPQDKGYYLIKNVNDFKQLLAFGQDSSLKFRLTTDLDLGDEPNFHIPYLAGDFDGNSHKISNLSFNFDFVSDIGLFGYLVRGGRVNQVRVGNASITGGSRVGGIVGQNRGDVSNSYFTGSVSGDWDVGGLVGENRGTVSSSYSSGNVAGSNWSVGGLVGCNVGGFSYVGGIVSDSHSGTNVTGQNEVGGLVGDNFAGIVSNSYSTGSVTGTTGVGGLVGTDYGRLLGLGAVSNSFWDIETSGQAPSAGGTGKTTAEMQNISTFSGAGWNVTAVADPSARNIAYIWNIVDEQTYPFLSWQPVS